MTSKPGRTGRQLCAAAEEALTEAAFRTGEFTSAEDLFGEALTLAGQDGDRVAEALAGGGQRIALGARCLPVRGAALRCCRVR